MTHKTKTPSAVALRTARAIVYRLGIKHSDVEGVARIIDRETRCAELEVSLRNLLDVATYGPVERLYEKEGISSVLNRFVRKARYALTQKG